MKFKQGDILVSDSKKYPKTVLVVEVNEHAEWETPAYRILTLHIGGGTERYTDFLREVGFKPKWQDSYRVHSQYKKVISQ